MQASILIISPIPTHPQTSGNRARLYSLLKSLKSGGCEITFLYLERPSDADMVAMTKEWDLVETTPYSKPGLTKKFAAFFMNALKNLSPNIQSIIDTWFSNSSLFKTTRPLGVDDWYDPHIDHAVLRLKSKATFDAVIVEYVYLSKALENFGNDVTKIIDTHDVFSDRHQQFISRGKNPVFFYTSPEQEARGLNRADLILAIQEVDRQYFSGICKRDVVTIGHVPPFVAENDSRSPSTFPTRLLYVATNIIPNQDAIEFFLNEIWPRLLDMEPQLEFDIVGDICFFLKDRVDANCKLHFFVRDLDEYYSPRHIVINPVRIGTGIKIKNIEALFKGNPLVTTSTGAQGLEQWADKAFLSADGAKEFADCVYLLLSNTTECRTLVEQAHLFADDYRQQYRKSIAQLIELRLKSKKDQK